MVEFKGIVHNLEESDRRISHNLEELARGPSENDKIATLSRLSGSISFLISQINDRISFLISQINEETCDLHNILPIFSTIQCFQQTKQCISSFLAFPLLEPIFSPPKDIFDNVH